MVRHPGVDHRKGLPSLGGGSQLPGPPVANGVWQKEKTPPHLSLPALVPCQGLPLAQTAKGELSNSGPTAQPLWVQSKR